MSEKEFIERIKDILLIEGEVDLNSFIKIDSLANLILIQFYDEHFRFKLFADTLNQAKTIGDLASLIRDQLK
jgi:acyl carrier protein